LITKYETINILTTNTDVIRGYCAFVVGSD